MNRSTFTQSGELVTISRLKIKEKWKFLRSLRFRITVILVIIGIVPCVILEKSIVNSYEDRAVSVRSITVKNQCDIAKGGDCYRQRNKKSSNKRDDHSDSIQTIS